MVKAIFRVMIKRVKIYESFDAENQAERRRKAVLSSEQRIREFEAIQARAWGADWVSKPIEKVATVEAVRW